MATKFGATSTTDDVLAGLDLKGLDGRHQRSPCPAGSIAIRTKSGFSRRGDFGLGGKRVLVTGVSSGLESQSEHFGNTTERMCDQWSFDIYIAPTPAIRLPRLCMELILDCPPRGDELSPLS